MIIRLSAALRPLATGVPLISALVQEAYFQTQRIAHRKLIAPYKGRRATNSARLEETPLLIGYFETGFGLGEHAKGLASALAHAGVQFAVYPYNGFSNRPRAEAPWAAYYDVDNIHAINILSMAANQTHNARRIIGEQHFDRSYNVLVSPWELPRAPEAWRRDLGTFDELWALSDFVANAFRPVFPKPIMVVPPCISLDANTLPDRRKFDLDGETFYFLFSFDFSSRPQRKNPAAVVRAFELAFSQPHSDKVGLLLKLSGDEHRHPQEVSAIEQAARRDNRIRILRGDWKRADMLALLASMDCYVSLHRSEGFGMGMAEAMALGKPVIGTAFSGSADFLSAQTGYPIPYALRPVRAGEYPFSDGNLWAEPDVQAAAEAMRIVAARSDEVRRRARAGQEFVRRYYSPESIGALVARRLGEIGGALAAGHAKKRES